MRETIGSHLILSAIGDLLWSSKKKSPNRAKDKVIPAAENNRITFLPSLSTMTGVKPELKTMTAPVMEIIKE